MHVRVSTAIQTSGVSPGWILLQLEGAELRDSCLPAHDVVGICSVRVKCSETAELALTSSLGRSATSCWKCWLTELRERAGINFGQIWDRVDDRRHGGLCRGARLRGNGEAGSGNGHRKKAYRQARSTVTTSLNTFQSHRVDDT